MAFSFIAIVGLAPFLILIMNALKCIGEHCIFYQQPRIGMDGDELGLLEYATMLKVRPSVAGVLYASMNDTRLLPMREFLRKIKINEFPQLKNILIGQMSTLGYRLIMQQYFEGYSMMALEIVSQPESKEWYTSFKCLPQIHAELEQYI
jgi:lipopolysaccharide/colanic/teichoic acid biosynthesis glycosyltransferase